VRRPLGLLLVSSLISAGCFDVATLVKVNGDGSGTISIRTVLTEAALARIRQIDALGGNTQPFDLLSEQQARDDAARFGQGVTYVSSVPIKTATGSGREALYAFSDVAGLQLAQQASLPGGAIGSADSAPPGVALSFERRPDGNAVIRIRTQFPELPGSSAAPGFPASSGGPSPEQLAMLKQALAGARVSITVEPGGRLVRSSSPYVDGNSVTLLEVNVDQLLTSEMLERFRGARTTSDVLALMKDAPGLKVPLDPETTIEFTPSP
jgi:hypothetical protein